MRRTVIAVPLLVSLALLGSHSSSVLAVAAWNTAETADDPVKSSDGTVKSVASNAMTITGSSGGGGSFTQTFVVDAETKVIAKGAGTASAAKGGKLAITDVVAAGDRVSVSYKPAGTRLQATEIRVTAKGK